MSDFPIKTQRLNLRLAVASDAPNMLKLFNQADFIANIRDKKLRSVAEVEKEINGLMKKHQEDHGFSMYVMDTSDTACIGLCGLVKRDELDIPDIGFAILSDYQGMGYVKEAGQAVLNHGFNTLNLDKIAAIVKPDNMPSIAVINSLGLGFVKGFQLKPEEPNLKYFELSKSTYLKQNR